MASLPDLPQYEVFALRYATRNAKRRDNIIGGDPHDADMPMDYYVWLIRGGDSVVLVDTGFDAAAGAKRNRTLLRTPAEALKLLGIDASAVRDVIVTHMHYDHAGTLDDYPNAIVHLQDDEVAFATGRHMCHARLRRGYEVEHVTCVVRLVFAGRTVFHRDSGEIAPGITVHHVGGHTPGMQVVRVHTKRGWVVLASDASHYYEHFETDACFPIVFNVGDLLAGYATLRRLAASPQHIIPGHDPLVMFRYPPASPELKGIGVRLDVAPNEQRTSAEGSF